MTADQWTMIAAICSVNAPIAAGLLQILRAELRGLHQAIVDLKETLRAEIAAVRSELKTEIREASTRLVR